MALSEKQITLTGIDLLDFTGFNDEKLNLIKEHFDGNIVMRGDTLNIKSDTNEYEKIEKVVNELIFLQKRQGSIKVDDVKLVLELIGSNEEKLNNFNNKFNVSSQDIKNIILYNKTDFIKPRTQTQLEYAAAVKENDITFAIGPAGTGKTYLAVAFAVAALKNKQINKIIITRPAVEAGESLGFLPGDLNEKIDPYLRPLFDSLEDMIPADKLKTYLDRNVIEIVPLAYMRGRTLNNAFIILDEAQNATTTQMKMFLTRIGANSKAVITGDDTQIDLPKRDQSGLVQIQLILKGIQDISFVYFKKSDVVRHRLVKDIIDAYEKYNAKNEKQN
ncbi:MAG TPA: PhoH family protein [Ignavibacteria bacterium]|nr:PhoH family protein [Ignavibacteria bacterium]